MDRHGSTAVRQNRHAAFVAALLLAVAGVVPGCNGNEGDAGPVCGATGDAVVGGAWSPEMED